MDAPPATTPPYSARPRQIVLPAIRPNRELRLHAGVKYVDGKKYVKFSFEGYNNTAFSRWLPVDKDGHREL